MGFKNLLKRSKKPEQQKYSTNHVVGYSRTNVYVTDGPSTPVALHNNGSSSTRSQPTPSQAVVAKTSQEITVAPVATSTVASTQSNNAAGGGGWNPWLVGGGVAAGIFAAPVAAAGLATAATCGIVAGAATAIANTASNNNRAIRETEAQARVIERAIEAEVEVKNHKNTLRVQERLVRELYLDGTRHGGYGNNRIGSRHEPQYLIEEADSDSEDEY